MHRSFSASVFVAKLLVLFVVSLFFVSPPLSQAAVENWQQSASIVPKSQTDFSSQTFRDSLKKLQATGANYVTLIVPYYQDSIFTTAIYRDWNTPTDESLVNAIRYAHSLGLNVMVKVHVEPKSGEWRALINPVNRTAWFTSYGTILNNLADIAGRENVAGMTIGTELVKMASSAENSTNTANWNTLISQVKSRYSGQLTYSANHSGLTEKNDVGFWNQLDFIGLSAYFELDKYNPNPTVESLKSSWDYYNNTEIKPLSQRFSLPVVFTEVGYRSLSGAHSDPWSWERQGSVDQTEQARDYEALFSYWNTQPFFNGVHWWDWDSNPNPDLPTGYSPQNKQAEQVMKQWFSLGGSPTPTPTPTPPPGTAAYTVKPTVPASLPPSQPAPLAVEVSSGAAVSNLIVDVEIYTLSGTKVFQQFWENQSLATAAKKYDFIWTPSSSGDYRLKTGIFSAGWASNLSWHDEVATLKVTPSPTPSPTSTPTPVPTASPSPTPQVTPTPTPPPPTPTVSPIPTTTPGITPTPSPSPTPTSAPPVSGQIEVWWPADGSQISGVQPFKVLLQGQPLSAYSMFWQVDGGILNPMGESQADYPHDESLVDVSSWSWRNNGPYLITFVAKNVSGSEIAKKSVNISVVR